MPRINGFPDCCSAFIYSGFGGGHIDETEDFTKQECIKWLCKNLTASKRSRATVVAILTTTQPNAIAAFEEVGFYMHPDGDAGGGVSPYTKNHRMSVMFMPLTEWDEKRFNEQYDPEKDTYVNQKNNGIKAATKREDKHW